MKKVIGALLFISGLIFIVWKSVSWDMTGMNSLLLNILGFMVMSIGVALFKMKSDESPVVDSKKNNKTTTGNIQKEINNEPKEYKTTDYSKYMPKQETDSSETEKD